MNMKKEIRDTELEKIPYMLIVGEKEMESKTVGVRKQSVGDLGAQTIEEFAAHIQTEIDAKLA